MWQETEIGLDTVYVKGGINLNGGETEMINCMKCRRPLTEGKVYRARYNNFPRYLYMELIESLDLNLQGLPEELYVCEDCWSQYPDKGRWVEEEVKRMKFKVIIEYEFPVKDFEALVEEIKTKWNFGYGSRVIEVIESGEKMAGNRDQRGQG